MWLVWAPLAVVLCAAYLVVYVLLRTSGDGRGALRRLLHPSRRALLQEEYGGTGAMTADADRSPTNGPGGPSPA
ncbi:MAG: hypothetical protein M0029_02395 [Actinomycetota bacterium]|jgi:hypothetical protein|nr:hypothetical protein [Actinomycetota bacterium]